MKTTTRGFARSMAAVAVIGLLYSPARAATVDSEIGVGIGTNVDDVFGDGSGTPVHTSIASVTYEAPVLVKRSGLQYFEVLGTAQGTGWGGEFQELDGSPEAEPFPALSHYSYSIPFVLRYPSKDWDGTMVQYAHGYSPLSISVFFESLIGDANEARRFDIAEGGYVSDTVLSNERRHAFFAVNLSGLDRNGQFSAIASEGPIEGQPLNPSVDVPISRDLAQLAKRLLAKLAGKPVTQAIGTGHSGGALIMQFMASNLGFSLTGGFPLFDGGNFVSAYEPASETIFQGIVPLAGGGFPVHPAFPLTAKAILIGGDTDYADVEQVRYANRILRRGVDLNDGVRIYQFRNLPHAFAEIVESTRNQNAALAENFGFSPSPDADHMAPVVAAAIDNMHAWLSNGATPPRSRVNGQALDENTDGIVDRIVFALLNGQTTSFAPFAEDATLDQFFGETFEISNDFDPAIVRRYAEVLAALDHVSDSIALPNLRCRLGGYAFAADATLIPFADFSAHWKDFGKYESCVQGAMKDLERDGLYDKKIGKNVVITDEARALFGK